MLFESNTEKNVIDEYKIVARYSTWFYLIIPLFVPVFFLYCLIFDPYLLVKFGVLFLAFVIMLFHGGMFRDFLTELSDRDKKNLEARQQLELAIGESPSVNSSTYLLFYGFFYILLAIASNALSGYILKFIAVSDFAQSTVYVNTSAAVYLMTVPWILLLMTYIARRNVAKQLCV